MHVTALPEILNQICIRHQISFVLFEYVRSARSVRSPAIGRHKAPRKTSSVTAFLSPGIRARVEFLSAASVACVARVYLYRSRHCSRVFVIKMRVTREHCFLAFAAAVLVSTNFSSAARGRMLLASESPVNSDTINSILSKGIKIFTFGQNTEIPPPILQGATDLASFSTPFQPSDSYNTKPATILFQCRAVGNQIWTASECSA